MQAGWNQQKPLDLVDPMDTIDCSGYKEQR
jgi:hypothetical protein